MVVPISSTSRSKSQLNVFLTNELSLYVVFVVIAVHFHRMSKFINYTIHIIWNGGEGGDRVCAEGQGLSVSYKKLTNNTLCVLCMDFVCVCFANPNYYAFFLDTRTNKNREQIDTTQYVRINK